MIPPHLFYQIYLSFLDCTPPKCGELSECIDSAHSDTRIDQMCMTDAGTTQNNFIFPVNEGKNGQGKNGQEKMANEKMTKVFT